MRSLLALLLLTGCDGDVWAVMGPRGCWMHPKAQVDTIGYVLRSPSDTVGPATTCTTDERIIINPRTP